MGIYQRKVRGRKVKTFNARFMYGGLLYQRGGFADKDQAQDWIDTTRAGLRRGETGYIKPRVAQRIRPLIEEYQDYLRTLERTEMYAYTAGQRLKRLANECGWLTLGNFAARSFEQWRKSKPTFRKKKLKPVTLNQFLDHAVEFGNWLVKPRQMIQNNPMLAVEHVTAAKNDQYRRAAKLDELKKLLEKAPPARAIVYRFVIYVPLRRGALKEIVWSDFDLEGDRPAFTLRAELSKNNRQMQMAIKGSLRERLLELRGKAGPHARVFARLPSVDELRVDLEAAGVPFDDGKGNRRLDLHAFRKTAVRLLKQAGVPLDEAHVFLGHMERRTTEKYYDDDKVAPEISVAAEKMPEID